MVLHIVYGEASSGMLKQEDHKFEVILLYMTPCLQKANVDLYIGKKPHSFSW